MSTAIFGDIKRMLKVEVVTQLPTIGKSNRLYFVLNGDTAEENRYDEYIWVKDETHPNGYFELVGYKYVDLSPYYTKTEVDNLLSKKVDLTEYNLFKNSTNQSITNLETKLDEHIEDFNDQVNTINSLNNTVNSLSNTVASHDTKFWNLENDTIPELQATDAQLNQDINTLTTNLNSEISSRTSQDTVLQANIDTVTSNLNDEITARTEADSNLQSQITNLTTVVNSKADAGSFKTINGESIEGTGDISIDLTLYKIVPSLPTTNIDNTKIYLVVNTESESNNEYIEYIYVNNKWEELGKYKAEVDLSPYYTKTEIDTKFDTKLNITDAENTYVAKETGKGLSTNDFNNTYKDAITWIEDFNSVSTLVNIPCTKRLVIANIAVSETMSISAAIPKGRELHIVIKNTSDSDITVTLPIGNSYINLGGNSFIITPHSYAEVNIISNGTIFYVRFKEYPQEIIMTIGSNPEVMAIMYQKGLCANADYMTKEEAEAAVKSDFLNGKDEDSETISPSDSIFYNTNIVNFDELKYFTGIKELPTCTFHTCKYLTSVTLQDGLTKIGDSCFANCSKLEAIALPEKITYVASNLCKNCTSLKSIAIPNGVTIFYDSAFDGCSALESITIPDGVTSIGSRCFTSCRSIKSVTIPKSVDSIGYRCFYGCSGIKDFTIEESNKTVTIGQDILDDVYMKVTNLTVLCKEVIGDGRFYATHITANVTNFNTHFSTEKTTELHLGPRVSSVDTQSMYSKDGMNISVDESNETYSSADGVLFNKDKTKLIRFSKDALQPNYEIPSSVTSIGDYAFHECRKLTNINIPSGVTAIGSYALSKCTSLTQISLPSTLEEIGQYAFILCEALESINIPSSVTSIGRGALYACSSLASEIEIPSGVTYIGQDIFYNCSSLLSIKILGTDVRMIDSDCFSGCVSLKSIYCNTSTAPNVNNSAFGLNESTYTGRNTYNTSENILYVPENSTGYDSSYWLSPLCDPTCCGFTLHYDTKYIDPSKAVAGDYCLYDKQANRLIIVQNDKLNADDFPLTNYTPVGVVVIPGSHDVYGDGSCGVMSLKEMNNTTPDTGSTSYLDISWGDSNTDIPSLTNYNVVCHVGSVFGTINESVQGTAKSETYLPSDKFSTVQNPYDTDTYYYYNGFEHCIPSPYNDDDTRNPAYYQTSSPSSTANAMSDFDGKNNTNIMTALATAEDWKTASGITNSYSSGYYPAACCCWRYHTDGTSQGQWYLPACGEFGYIMPKFNKIQVAINALISTYGDSVGVQLDNENFYLSSSEYNNEFARGMDVKYGNPFAATKSSSHHVRAFLRV